MAFHAEAFTTVVRTSITEMAIAITMVIANIMLKRPTTCRLRLPGFSVFVRRGELCPCIMCGLYICQSWSSCSTRGRASGTVSPRRRESTKCSMADSRVRVI